MSNPIGPAPAIDLTSAKAGDPIPTGVGLRLVEIAGVLNATTNGTTFTPVGASGFGADTVIQQLNSTPALVNTLELINTLTVNTAGSETATWTIKVPSAGAQINAQVIAGTGTLFPAGTNSVPGVQVGNTGTGMVQGTSGGDFVGLVLDGSLEAYARASSFILTSVSLRFGGEASHAITGIVSADSTTQNLSALPLFSGVQTDFVIGTAGANATTAVGGFLQIPTCAGTPTGTAHLNTGKAAMVLDTTANKLWLSSTAGTWKGVVIA